MARAVYSAWRRRIRLCADGGDRRRSKLATPSLYGRQWPIGAKTDEVVGDLLTVVFPTVFGYRARAKSAGGGQGAT